MQPLKYNAESDELIIELEGHIDSLNASQIEEEIRTIRTGHEDLPVLLDCERLEYISSAGLRVVLRLLQESKETKMVNVTGEVYEVLEMTGFTEMMPVSKAYRMIDVEGCEVIGQGANGRIYRIDRDTIVKVFWNPDSLPEIKRERELARTAFVSGVPTAIPYDVVRIKNGGYGSVFELLNAKTFAQLLKDGEPLDDVVKKSVDLLRIIHGTAVKPNSMPNMKETALNWAGFLKDYLPSDLSEKLCSLVEAVPEDFHMLHGDYHLKNIMLQNGESLLIDMDTLCYGHPVFELASMFNAYRGYGETDHSVTLNFLGLPYEFAGEIWQKSLQFYLRGADDEQIKAISEKAQIIGYTRMMRRSIRRGGLETDAGRIEIENCRRHLEDLLPRIDSLVF